MAFRCRSVRSGRRTAPSRIGEACNRIVTAVYRHIAGLHRISSYTAVCTVNSYLITTRSDSYLIAEVSVFSRNLAGCTVNGYGITGRTDRHLIGKLNIVSNLSVSRRSRRKRNISRRTVCTFSAVGRYYGL